MATKSELRNSSCGKCTKKVGNVGICCEGSCGRWYHPRCIKMSNADYKKWGDSSEKWRCENCVDEVLANHLAISVTQGEPANARSSNDMNTDSELHHMFRELEDKISVSLITTIREALEPLKEAMESKMNDLEKKVHEIEERLASLELRRSVDTESGRTESAQHNDREELDREFGANQTVELQVKLDSLTKTIEAQQKTIELQERETRKANVIILGLDELDEREDTPTRVKSFLGSQLEIESVDIERAMRLGKKRGPQQNRARPVLVHFSSTHEKAKVMKMKRKLKEKDIKVYINHDWTKAQRLLHMNLRKMRQQAIEDGHTAHIKLGHLFVDGCQVDTYTPHNVGSRSPLSVIDNSLHD